MEREGKIIRVSIVNVAGNAILAVAKGVIGVMCGSIAITLDAINSLADALSSVIAIIGTKIAGKHPDRAHPFGYGRTEYLTSIVIAALILSAGLSSFKEAVSSILHPSTPLYTTVALVIVTLAAVVKFGLGFYLIREGKKLESATLLSSGKDSLMDGGVSVATLIAALVYLQFNLAVEAWLAAVIALLIVKNGFDLLRETTSKLLGERPDPELIDKVEREARSVKGVRLANNLVLNDFGPNHIIGSIFVTVDSQMPVAQFDRIARRVQRRVRKNCGVMLTGVTPYPDNEDKQSTKAIRSVVGRTVWGTERVVELRGLYIDEETQSVRFDAVADLATQDVDLLRDHLVKACERDLPGWQIEARVFIDAAD